MAELAKMLTGRTAIITGASRGLGLEIAKVFLTEGARVALCARDENLLAREGRDLAVQFGAQNVIWRACDVGSENGVLAFVDWAVGSFGSLDCLVNNAGVYGPMGPIETVDIAAWIAALNINLLGSVLMARAVVPQMKRQRSGSIIQISGGGATNPLPNITAYAASKAAVVRFAESLALELKDFGISVNSIAPGALNTRLLDEVVEAGPDRVGADFYEKSMAQRESGGAPLNAGAKLAAFLASDRGRGVTGKLISAIWDKWADWPDHADELEETDLYTLRRITGRDRNCAWGDK